MINALTSDASGSAVQHLQYLSFLETLANQTSTSWATPYTFSGKEKDPETGYSYFGARYYDSDVSVWLSVDPLASRYPSTSPYMYVRGNPVMLIDPNGLYDVKSTYSRREARKMKRYRKKADKIISQHDKWSWANNRDEIHDAMNEKYKFRRFMYSKVGSGNNSMKTFEITSSLIDLNDGIKDTHIQSVNDNFLLIFKNKSSCQKVLIKTVGEGSITLKLDGINKEKVPFQIDVKDSDGNSVVSGNITAGNLTFNYSGGNQYIVNYYIGGEVVSGQYIDKNKTWSWPLIKVNMVGTITTTSYSQLKIISGPKNKSLRQIVEMSNLKSGY